MLSCNVYFKGMLIPVPVCVTPAHVLRAKPLLPSLATVARQSILLQSHLWNLLILASCAYEFEISFTVGLDGMKCAYDFGNSLSCLN